MTNIAELLGQLRELSVIDLENPRQMRDPIFDAHWPGYVYALYRRHEPGLERRTSASGMIITPEHAGTHMDALCHQAEDGKMHGGVRVSATNQTPAGFTELGIDTVAPQFGRGVLLDLPAAIGGPLAPESDISVDMLRAAATGIVIRPGDTILVRTGYGAKWYDPNQYLKAPGMSAEASEWVAAQEPVVAGIDNVAWDYPGRVSTHTQSTLPGHIILLVRHGIYLLENLQLEALASTKAKEFLFVVIPLKLTGGTGSPVRPVAMVPLLP